MRELHRMKFAWLSVFYNWCKPSHAIFCNRNKFLKQQSDKKANIADASRVLVLQEILNGAVVAQEPLYQSILHFLVQSDLEDYSVVALTWAGCS